MTAPPVRTPAARQQTGENSNLKRTLPRDHSRTQERATDREAALRRLENHLGGWQSVLSWLDAHTRGGGV